jgi:hypothetical protein
MSIHPGHDAGPHWFSLLEMATDAELLWLRDLSRSIQQRQSTGAPSHDWRRFATASELRTVNRIVEHLDCRLIANRTRLVGSER